MADYIKRSDVLALQTELRFDKIEQIKHYRCRHIDPLSVKLLPAADVRENVHGEWKQQQFILPLMGIELFDWVCSNCGAVCEDQYEKPSYNYCPMCGADMRGQNNEP